MKFKILAKVVARKGKFVVDCKFWKARGHYASDAREVRVEIRDATRPPPPLAAARGEEREERRRHSEEREGRETARGRGRKRRKAARKREKESTGRASDLQGFSAGLRI
ncbi:hypothetical protein F2Q68_00006845 [Brassica cretica]|uniref:Uncharacterized protein n=1 Tax=Brassica cretica TaxID=69181 RepID=A0A8S9JJ20_BRACR|nr:hypothetical protein F2Q68_00006845 [Brassica cretica]